MPKLEPSNDDRGIVHGQAQVDAALRKILSYTLSGDDRFKWWSNNDLIAAYQRTSCEPGDPVADALRAEIERRGSTFDALQVPK